MIAARNRAPTASDAVRSPPGKADAVIALAAAEQALDGSLGRRLAVAEACPDLKADQTIRELSEEPTSTENKVGFARQPYNDAALDFNNAQGQFPTPLTVRIFGFVPWAMLRATESAAERQGLRQVPSPWVGCCPSISQPPMAQASTPEPLKAPAPCVC